MADAILVDNIFQIMLEANGLESLTIENSSYRSADPVKIIAAVNRGYQVLDSYR